MLQPERAYDHTQIIEPTFVVTRHVTLPALHKLLPAKQIQTEVAAFTQHMPAAICFAQQPWAGNSSRSAQLMQRFAAHGKAFVIEPAAFSDIAKAHWVEVINELGVKVLRPELPRALTSREVVTARRSLLNQLLEENKVTDYFFWNCSTEWSEAVTYFSPALHIADLPANYTVLQNQPEEQPLLQQADLVFSSTLRNYELSKLGTAPAFMFRNGVNAAHFAKARTLENEPADQSGIPLIRMGFVGEINDSLDLEMLAEVAAARPGWHMVFIGPITIEKAKLPTLRNLHFLGEKPFAELPAYLSGWDATLLPYKMQQPAPVDLADTLMQYLAAGRPVVATQQPEIAKPFGDMGLVQLAANAPGFIKGIEKALDQNQDMVWQHKADRYLKEHSWDATWNNMVYLMQLALTRQLS